MKKEYKFFIVDDDPVSIELLAKVLRSHGQTVSHTAASRDAVARILEARPDCVLLDIMMPEVDGLELCKRLRREPALEALKIVIVSAKAYEFDRRRAFSFGADGYLVKPVDTRRLFARLRRIIEDQVELTFWGIRGTLPVPGSRAVRYGGNTSCITLEFSKGIFFIFDAGTGIKELSDHLMASGRLPMEAKIFISHAHWDHINALPFFVPLYIPGNEFEILGPSHGDVSMRDLISGQMDGVHFPIKIKEFGSNILFRDLAEEELAVDEVRIRTMLLSHPGHCLGYRISYRSRSICYITDNELYPENTPYHSAEYLEKLLRFIHGSDALVTDCTYRDEEYEKKISWGHSATAQVADLAHRGEVKTLFLYHHDPDQADCHIDEKLDAARRFLEARGSAVRCIAPREKEVFHF